MKTPEASTAQRVPWWRTRFGEAEIRRVASAIEGEHISQGALTAEFEHELARILGVPHVVATTSGSMALLMALMATGIRAGDEVIVPNRTWIATAHAPYLLGAKPVFVDVEAGRPIIDAGRIEEHITPRTRAILPVHLNGRAADMAEIQRVAEKHGLTVIEDAAQAFMSRNAAGWLGTQSALGCFSLSVAKLIATGQGGFIAVRDQTLYDKLLALRTHGIASVIHPVWEQPGFNFRFTDIQAAIGLAQLDQLDERIAAVQTIYRRYREGLRDHPAVRLIPVDTESGELPLYIEALCADRDALVAHLAREGVEVRPFYPNLDEAPYFQASGAFPNALRFARDGLFLPCGPAQPAENIERALAALDGFEG